MTSSRDRDEVFLELTRSICPVCKRTVDAEVNARDDKVYLRKRCADHGEFEALVYGDAQMYVDIQRFNKPGTRPLTTQTEVKDGCPSDCGLCPEHKQHACLGIIEVNTGCNLDCPICFADSGHQPDGYSITLEQCAAMLDVFVAAEGEPEVVMFSGGEPTIHRDILGMVDLAQERPINAVNVHTNGIRLASDKRFVAELGRRNRPGRRVNVYLQFDGFEESTHLAIRGRDLREIKQRALDNCAEAGLTVTLVAAIERGLNEHEIGAIVRHGLGHPAVRSIAFQPVTHSGRHVEFDPLTRMTNSDVLHAIAGQLPRWFTTDDFFPVPCCAPTCRSITYLLTQGRPEDPDFGLVPIPRLLDVEDHLDYIANRVLPDQTIREALERLWSASAFLGTDTSDNVALATGGAAARGLADRVAFHRADAEALPLPDGGWDVVVCECALCTFPSKPTAVAEMVRVLGPGGRVGITDITADRDRLPPELRGLDAWVACVADARTPEAYRSMLTDAGLRVVTVEHHDRALDRMIRQIEARLELLRMTARPRLEAAGVDLGRVRPVLDAARAAVRDGIVGYVLIVAEKPAGEASARGSIR